MPRRNLFLIILLILAAVVNLAGAFGPELGFDALWYHLTLPKLYRQWNEIKFVPGGLLYYSAMPRLGEFLYMGLMRLMSPMGDTGAHLINWGFGVGTAGVVYLLARKFLGRNYSLLAVLVFYATPLVGWLSGSAYIDLIRTFFEAAAFLLVLNGSFVFAGAAIGLAISTKTLALGSLGIFGVLIYLKERKWQGVLKFLLPAVLISAPWFLWAYQNTGYPFYPIGAGILDQRHDLGIERLGVFGVFGDFWKVFMVPEDVISPIYVLIIPFMVINFRTFLRFPLILATLYFLLSYLVWWITPRTGGGRFLLPYLPVWAVLAATTIRALEAGGLRKLMVGIVLAVSIVNIGYRAAAQTKLIPYFSGKQTKTEYLCQNLDFQTGVFVDCNGWAKKNIKNTDLVYVSGVHNLYYLDFPFVHETWFQNEKVNYCLVQGNGNCPAETTKKWKLVHVNIQTNTKFYQLYNRHTLVCKSFDD